MLVVDKLTGVPVAVLIQVAVGLIQAKLATTSVAATPPVLLTRTPTKKVFGPSVTLLLSKPTTSQVVTNALIVVADQSVAGATRQVPIKNPPKRLERIKRNREGTFPLLGE